VKEQMKERTGKKTGDFCFVMGTWLWSNKGKSLKKTLGFSSYSPTSFGLSYGRLKNLGSQGLK